MKINSYLAITNHAIQRIKERIGIEDKNEIKKIVKKAWKSKNKICEEFWESRCNFKDLGFSTYHYRKYDKYIFCFQKKYIEFVLITVFSENNELLVEKYASNTKRTFRRNKERSILPKMHSAQGADVWGKDYFRTRFDLRRETDKREIRDPSSMREAPRSKHIPRPWIFRQEISRMGSIKQNE